MKFTVPSPIRIGKMFLGAVCLLLGLFALVTPFTPGATFFIFLGLELLGIRFIVWDGNDKIGKFLLKHGVPKKYLK